MPRAGRGAGGLQGTPAPQQVLTQGPAAARTPGCVEWGGDTACHSLGGGCVSIPFPCHSRESLGGSRGVRVTWWE